MSDRTIKPLRKARRIATRLRMSVLNRKPLKKHKSKSNGSVTFSVNHFLAVSMREVARRQKRVRRLFIEDFYNEALTEFLQNEFVPKRIVKPNRQKVRIQAAKGFIERLDACAKIAYKQELPVSAILEKALRAYLTKPENYLGEAFETRYADQYERIN